MTSALLEEFEPEELAKMTDAEKQAAYLKRVPALALLTTHLELLRSVKIKSKIK